MNVSLFSPLLAQVSGNGMVQQLMTVLIVGLCLLIIWALGRWFITRLGAPALVMTFWTGLFILLAAIFLINFLLGLGGHPFIRW